MDPLSLTTVLMLALSCTAIGLAVIAMMAARTLNKKFQQSLELIKGLHKHVQQKDERLTTLEAQVKEYHQAALHLASEQTTQGTKLDDLDRTVSIEFDKLEQQIQDSMLQDPITKQYQRANQLLLDGNSIQEVMEVCELPRAEVDILVGLLRK